MNRILGIHANRVDALRPVLRSPAIEALLPTARGGESFGFVFFQGDELLHQKRPLPEGTPAALAEVVGDDVRTDCALVSLAEASSTGFRAQATGPHRYRRWAFATTGAEAADPDARARWVECLPDHLRRGFGSGTTAEALFAAILAELPDSGRIDDPELPEGVIEDAIRRALDLAAMRARTTPTFAALLTNGIRTVGLAVGAKLDYVVRLPVGTSGKNEPRITALVDAASARPDVATRSGERALLFVTRALDVRESPL